MKSDTTVRDQVIDAMTPKAWTPHAQGTSRYDGVEVSLELREQVPVWCARLSAAAMGDEPLGFVTVEDCPSLVGAQNWVDLNYPVELWRDLAFLRAPSDEEVESMLGAIKGMKPEDCGGRDPLQVLLEAITPHRGQFLRGRGMPGFVVGRATGFPRKALHDLRPARRMASTYAGPARAAVDVVAMEVEPVPSLAYDAEEAAWPAVDVTEAFEELPADVAQALVDEGVVEVLHDEGSDEVFPAEDGWEEPA